MNKTVGDLLREARNKKGLALQNIERSTGIATHNLLAIELDQFSLIEADKLESYLKTYAQEVEVPYSSLMAATGFPDFSEPTPAPVQEPVVPVAPVSVEKQVKANFENIVKNNPAPQATPVSSAASANMRRTGGRSNKSGGFFKFVLSLLLLGAIAFAGFTLYKQYFADFLTKKEVASSSSSSSESEKSSSSSSYSSTSASSTKPSSSAPAPTTKLVVTGGGEGIDVTVTTSKKPVKIELSLAGSGESWIGVSNSDIGGVTLNTDNPKVVATLNEGTTQSLIELGVTQGVTIKINDQVLDMSDITSTTSSAINLQIQ